MSTRPEDSFMVEHLLRGRRVLRVSVVTETYPPEVNGVAGTVVRVVDGLCARGHEVQLVRPRQSALEQASDGGNRVEVLMRALPIPRYPQLKMGLPARRALVQLWTRRRPDLVHIVTEGPLGWSALQAALHLRLPVVSDFRTNFHAYSQHYGVAWLRQPIMGYLRKFHNRTACTMVPTDGLRSELDAAGFENLKVVSRGVDATLFAPSRRSEALRAEWGAGPQTLVALYVGRLAAEKNLGALVMAAQALREHEPRLRLVLVGEGPEQESLRQQLPDAVFAGVRRGVDLAAHYASADAFLFPSLTETFGNVVPEAMASGLPVVAYALAAAGQLIRHGENGLLARPDDLPAFCRAAGRLAHDRAEARALGLQARATAQALDWARIVEAVEQQYLAAMPAPLPATAELWEPALPHA